jgi:hypothetical protein
MLAFKVYSKRSISFNLLCEHYAIYVLIYLTIVWLSAFSEIKLL